MPAVTQRVPAPGLHKKFCDNLKALRREKAWTQEIAAKRCRMTQPQYCDIETGRFGVKLDTVERIARGFGVDPAELLQQREVAAA